MKTLVANWKMHVGIRESAALARAALLALRGRAHAPDVVVCPPFTALADVHKIVARSHVAVGAQDLFWEETGAFTGEISPRMVAETGAAYAIVGHSERRRLFGETDETVGKKTAAALAHRLTPVVCVGETAEERAAGRTEAVIGRQLRAAFASAALHEGSRVLIAYEPVWAIGSGHPASPQDAVAAHAFLRRVFRDEVKGGGRAREGVLYGGSVDADNAFALLREDEIDGILIGGASLNAAQFTAIVAAAGDVLEGLASRS